MTKTIKQEALEIAIEASGRRMRNYDVLAEENALRRSIEALCRAIEALDAKGAELDALRRDMSDAVDEWHGRWVGAGESHSYFMSLFSRFIIPKPKPDPLAQVAREMVLLDGVVRTDNQKAAIREGRAANTAADDFYDRLRTALAARGLKLVEVGDAD